MSTVTSVSGGRTSSYLALEFPTDYNIFSLVRIEDKRCTPKDKPLIRYVEDKIQMPFIATTESVKTLYVLQQLEQDLGKEIIWVTGDAFETVIKKHSKALPNRRMRFCTTDMKMLPIFWYCYLYIMKNNDDLVTMNIGYRADEPRRQATDYFKFAKSCTIANKHNNWTEMEWRESRFPLRTYRIDNLMIRSYFAKKPNYIFHKFSNCAGCFNKNESEIQEQFILEPEIMQWFKEQEQSTGNRWNISGSLEMILSKDYTDKQMYLFDNVTCNCTD